MKYFPKSVLGFILLFGITILGVNFIPTTNAGAVGPDTETLFFVKTKNTGSGKVELHTATKASNYKSSDLHTATWFSTADADNGYWQVVGRDLYFIKVCNTGSGYLEVHSATASSGYTSGMHAAYSSYLGGEYVCNKYKQSDSRPITISGSQNGFPRVFMTTGFSGDKTYAQSASGDRGINSNNYATTTPFGSQEANDAVCSNGILATRYNAMTFIKKQATGTGKIEFFQASQNNTSVSGTPSSQLVIATPTFYQLSDAKNGVFSSVDVNGDGRQEVSFVKTKNTDTKSIEVFYTNPSNYQQLGLASGTWFSLSDAQNGVLQFGSDS